MKEIAAKTGAAARPGACWLTVPNREQMMGSSICDIDERPACDAGRPVSELAPMWHCPDGSNSSGQTLRTDRVERGIELEVSRLGNSDTWRDSSAPVERPDVVA